MSQGDEQLVQISLVYVGLEGRPRGERPTFELKLRPEQSIVGFENYWTTDRSTRETVDHHANIWVATRL